MREITFDVPDVSCQHCIKSISEATKNIGVADVQVDLISKKVYVSYDPTKIDDEAIRDAIEEEGYAVKGETPGNTIPVREGKKTLDLMQK